MATTDGQPPRIWFDNGEMHIQGHPTQRQLRAAGPTLRQLLIALEARLSRFLIHVDASPRGSDGRYLLPGQHREAMGVLWDQAICLAAAALRMGQSQSQVIGKHKNGLLAILSPTPEEVPLASLLGRLLFSVNHVDNKFPESVAAETVKMIEGLSHVIQFEVKQMRPEGGTACGESPAKPEPKREAADQAAAAVSPEPTNGYLPMGELLDRAGFTGTTVQDKRDRENARKCLEAAREKPEWVDRLAQSKSNPKRRCPRWLYHEPTALACLRDKGFIA